jgi:hypothetical protein
MFLEQVMTDKVEEKVEAPKEDWMTKKWRPMMAIMYMVSCIFDFVLFPILFTIVQFWEVQAANDAFRQWNPITLGGGGLFHVAMGAVLGVTAWSRGQEKMAGVATGPGASLPSAPMSSRVEPSFAPTQYQPSGFNGTSSQDFNSYQQPVTVSVGFGGKPAPPAAPQPLL